MMRSMYSAVVGLRQHQLRMDVIADNVANVNTVGFKRSRITFQDVFYQTLRGGSGPSEDSGRGGTNPRQVGLGVGLATIDVVHSQGASGSTGNPTDLMIQGDGFFVLTDGTTTYYSRAGNFAFDAAGDLVSPANGLRVQSADEGAINVPVTATSFSISADGKVAYIDDDELNEDQTVGLVKFSNPAGLEKVGENLYIYKSNAQADGAPELGTPGADGRGTLVPSALEMSNVELAQEFSDMILTQRGFQANARVISTSDEMLQELANLKR